MKASIEDVVAIICRVGKIEKISADDDYYEAGVSSINALELLVELEAVFEVTIPDESFLTTRTPRNLHALILSIKDNEW